MTKKDIINKIEDTRTWDSAKHRYAEKLLNEFDSEHVRSYLMKKYRDTNDYFYCSILKSTNQ